MPGRFIMPLEGHHENEPRHASGALFAPIPVLLVDLGGWQHESVVDAQIGAFDRTQFDELFDDVINGRVQQVVGVPALKTLRRGLARLSEKSG